MNIDLAQLACDRYEIADTLHRFAFGLDHGDADSLASAFTEDCIFDFRPAGRKLKIDFPKLNGREAIVNALIPFLGPLDTSHTVSNLQIEVSDDSATFHAARRLPAWIRKCAANEPLRLRAGTRRPEMAL